MKENTDQGTHYIMYDDGDEEELDLSKETFKMVDKNGNYIGGNNAHLANSGEDEENGGDINIAAIANKSLPDATGSEEADHLKDALIDDPLPNKAIGNKKARLLRARDDSTGDATGDKEVDAAGEGPQPKRTKMQTRRMVSRRLPTVDYYEGGTPGEIETGRLETEALPPITPVGTETGNTTENGLVAYGTQAPSAGTGRGRGRGRGLSLIHI